MGSLALRPGDSLTILKMALSVGFRSFGFPPVCDSSYRAPDSCPGGTHSRWMRQPSAGRTSAPKLGRLFKGFPRIFPGDQGNDLRDEFAPDSPHRHSEELMSAWEREFVGISRPPNELP